MAQPEPLTVLSFILDTFDNASRQNSGLGEGLNKFVHP
jgi:hypothetical protein